MSTDAETHFSKFVPVQKLQVFVCIIAFIRGVILHIKIFSTGLSVRYACVPNKYSIVFTTVQVKLHWKLPVLYIVTFD